MCGLVKKHTLYTRRSNSFVIDTYNRKGTISDFTWETL